MSKRIKKFSVVIPTKNRVNDLKKNIYSILNQTEKPSELLIVDQSEKNNLGELKRVIKNKVKLKYYYKLI